MCLQKAPGSKVCWMSLCNHGAVWEFFFYDKSVGELSHKHLRENKAYSFRVSSECEETSLAKKGREHIWEWNVTQCGLTPNMFALLPLLSPLISFSAERRVDRLLQSKTAMTSPILNILNILNIFNVPSVLCFLTVLWNSPCFIQERCISVTQKREKVWPAAHVWF